MIKVQVLMKQAKLPEGWVTWYTYADDDEKGQSIAKVQEASLSAKGYTVRVTGPGSPPAELGLAVAECEFCGDPHAEPSDGSCLL